MVKHTQTFRRQKLTNCLSAFDHFVGLALNESAFQKQSFKSYKKRCSGNSKTSMMESIFFFLQSCCCSNFFKMTHHFLMTSPYFLRSLKLCISMNKSYSAHNYSIPMFEFIIIVPIGVRVLLE